MNEKKIIQIRIDEENSAHVEVDQSQVFEEMGPRNKVYEIASDYVKVAGSIIKNLKEMEEQPSSIELEFGIRLAMTSGGLLSWIATDVSADASIGVKMIWEREQTIK